MRTGCCLAAAILAFTIAVRWPGEPVRVNAWLDMRRVPVIDAGHGGEDGGTVSAAGYRESDINLQIALRLHLLFRFYGIPAQMLRDRDISLHDSGATSFRAKKVSDLKNRAWRVGQIDNAMLISIHQNAFPQKNLKGAQTFFSQADGADRWALLTQEALRAAIDPGNKRQAAPVPDTLYLFSHVTCPGILVECGFLSNDQEAAFLHSPEGQCRSAMAILSGYLSYFHEEEIFAVGK